MIWAAGRRELTILVAVEALSALGIAVVVLLGRDVRSGVLEADRTGGGWSGFLP